MMDEQESVAVGRWLGMPELLFGLLDGPGTETAWQRLHAGGFQAEARGVRAAAGREQQLPERAMASAGGIRTHGSDSG